MIEVRNVSFTYPKSTTRTLKALDFQIQRGEVFGFLGPSGAGKTTTQKILIGLLKGFGGEVLALGRPIQSWGNDYYEQVGVSFELPNHYLKLTARENLNYFRALYAGPCEESERVLDLVGLSDDADRAVAEFSKGMRCRLNLARALLHRPSLLFLDEPTAGLDPVNARLIKDLICDLGETGRTIFLCTHNMTLAEEVCDRVAFLVGGEIKLIDSPSALKLRYGAREVRVEFGSNGDVSNRAFPLDGLGHNADFFEILRRSDVRTIHTQETTLEKIFVQVTGRGLE